MIYEADWSEDLDGWMAYDQFGTTLNSNLWVTVGGVLTFGSPYEDSLIAAPVSSIGAVTNYAVEAEVMVGECASYGLVARYDIESDSGPNATRGDEWFEVVDGEWSRYYGNNVRVEDVPKNTWNRIRLEVTGQYFLFSVDGRGIAGGSNNELLAGGPGRVGILGFGNCDLSIRSFKVIATGFGEQNPGALYGADEGLTFGPIGGSSLDNWLYLGDWQVDSSQMSFSGSGDGRAFPPYRPLFLSDFAVESEFQFTGIGPNCQDARYGISLALPAGGSWIGRSSDPTCSGQSATVELREGGDAEGATYAESSVSLDSAWHSIRLEVEDTRIRLYLDGQLIGESTDSRLPTVTSAYVFANGDIAVNVRNFRVISPADAIPPGAPQQTAAGQSGVDPAAVGTTPVLDVGIVSTTTGQIQVESFAPVTTAAAFLPSTAGTLAQVEHGTRTQVEITPSFPNPAEAEVLFAQWGWSGSEFAVYRSPDEAAVSNGLNEVDVGIHQLIGPQEALQALEYFAAARVELLGLWETPVDQIGTMSRAFVGPAGDGRYEASVYVAIGSQVVRVTAFSWNDYPLAEAVSIAYQVVGA